MNSTTGSSRDVSDGRIVGQAALFLFFKIGKCIEIICPFTMSWDLVANERSQFFYRLYSEQILFADLHSDWNSWKYFVLLGKFNYSPTKQNEKIV